MTTTKLIKIWEEGGAHAIPDSFNTRVPEIYQVEATSACNYECPFCYRFFGDRQNENSYFPIDLAKTMVDRGDFAGSYFIEFQLSGEPLLHPRLGQLIDIVKSAGLKTGLSTNGSLLHPKSGARIAERNMEAVCKLDMMTISVDAMDDELYEIYRPVKQSDKKGTQGPSFSFTSGDLMEAIELVLAQPKHPQLDLQIIELPGWEVQLEKLVKMVKDRGWDKKSTIVRTTPDCSIVTRGEASPEMIQEIVSRPHELCLNPWMSVTVLSSGKVVSCCFDFHNLNNYGDLRENTLAEIWQGKEVKTMRQAHMTGENLPPLCKTCYMKSPVMIHLKFMQNWGNNAAEKKTVYQAPGREASNAVAEDQVSG